MIDALYLDKLRSDSPAPRADRQPPLLRRLTIDPSTGGIENTLRSQQPIELPRIDDRRYLNRYRIIYGVGASADNDYDTADELVKRKTR